MDSALKRSLCPLGADTLVVETEGKGTKNKMFFVLLTKCLIGLRLVKEINRKGPGENTLDWAFLKR